ncbi:hypothetical protein GCM10010266_30610 [Streptomyces griseomycini]|nr:hypothetical protein GCM10010266_30610 [Streptomyces griseomycini]
MQDYGTCCPQPLGADRLRDGLPPDAERQAGSWIEVSVTTEHGHAVTQVNDGLGVPADERQAVLRRFHHRADPSGNGLGSAAARQTTEAHRRCPCAVIDRGLGLGIPIAVTGKHARCGGTPRSLRPHGSPSRPPPWPARPVAPQRREVPNASATGASAPREVPDYDRRSVPSSGAAWARPVR